MKHINLENLANGAFTQQVNREVEKVISNIQDPNTDATKVRKVTVVLSFKANENRDVIATGIEAKSSLAPAMGAVTVLHAGKDLRTGRVDAVEIGSGQIPGQIEIDFDADFDPDTGEIREKETRNQSQVIDLRKKA